MEFGGFSSALPRLRARRTLAAVKKKDSALNGKDLPGECPSPAICPLSRVKAGTVVCVRELMATPEVIDRLREMGLGEDQKLKLLSHSDSVICQVCNARVALSEQLADAIMVEPVTC